MRINKSIHCDFSVQKAYSENIRPDRYFFYKLKTKMKGDYVIGFSSRTLYSGNGTSVLTDKFNYRSACNNFVLVTIILANFMCLICIKLQGTESITLFTPVRVTCLMLRIVRTQYMIERLQLGVLTESLTQHNT